MKYYAIYDNLSEKYFDPALMVNDNVALRFFTDTVNNKENGTIFDNPQDFSLWKIAIWDERHGSIMPDLKKIADATSVKKGE